MIIVISSVLAMIFVCWMEIRRENKQNLTFRIVACALAIISLICVAIPPGFERKLSKEKAKTAVLLTDGFEKDSLRNLKNLPLFSTLRSITDKNKSVKFIPDLEYFVGTHPEFNQYYILGYGLEQHEMKVLKNHRLVFHGNGMPSGFRSVHWKKTIRSGDNLIIQGNFRNNSKKPLKLILKGLSTTLDSINLKPGSTETFELRTSPKTLGRTVYSLLIFSGNDTLANEKIPVIIEEKRTLKILVLSSSPDFETKFLKNWLYSEKYSLAMRSTISKDKFSTEFLNIEKTALNRINPSLLENFDLLIGDLALLSGMSPSENIAVQNQVSLGMGLVIRSDSEAVGSGFYKKAFNIRQSKNIAQKVITFNWPGNTAKKMSTTLSPPLEILPSLGDQPLVKDGQGHIIVSSKLYGAGRIILTTLADTYSWMLGNNPADYSSYWSFLIEKAARKTELTEQWSIMDQFPTVNKQTLIRLENVSDTVPHAEIESMPLRFQQDQIQSSFWTAEYWPSVSGWYTVTTNYQQTGGYVFDHDDWRSVKAEQKITNTRKFISNSKAELKAAANPQNFYRYTIESIYFFILFVLCCSYLWLETKLS